MRALCAGPPDGCSALFVLLCSRKEATEAAACTRGKSLRLGGRGGRGEGSCRMRTVSRGRSPGGMHKGGAGAVNLAAEARGWTEEERDEDMEGWRRCTPTPMPHDSRARKQYTAVLALRCQSGGRETAVAAQGQTVRGPGTPKSGQAAAQRQRSRVECKMRLSEGVTPACEDPGARGAGDPTTPPRYLQDFHPSPSYLVGSDTCFKTALSQERSAYEAVLCFPQPPVYPPGLPLPRSRTHPGHHRPGW